MVNSNDSIGTATVSRAYATLALAVDGLYVWEFFINLGYEWSVIKGRRPYRWTIWIYSTVRLTTLMGVIIEFVTSIMAAPTNCKVWTIFQFGSGYMTFSLSSLLIILRIIAIWNKNKFVVAFAVAVWLTTASFFIYGITHLHSEWDPNELGCGNPQTESNKLAITAMPITDIALLLIMLIGLLRIGLRGGGKFSVGRLLWKQGVIYLLIVTIAEIPPAVFILLDLNPLLNLMFLIPSLITMSIAATRMYRSLTDFVHHNDIVNSLDIPKIDDIISDTRWATAIPPPRRQFVNISNEHGKSSTSQMGQDVPYIGSDGELGDKAARAGFRRRQGEQRRMMSF